MAGPHDDQLDELDDNVVRQRSAILPWSGAPDEIACTFAFTHLANSLPRLVTVHGTLHPETYVAAAGAIAGFAAQRSLFEISAPEIGVNVTRATTPSGDRFWFSDALAEALFGRTEDDAAASVWPLAAGAAVTAGLPVDDLPDPAAMFQNVTTALGLEHEGVPSVPVQFRPLLPARQVLKAVWPLALTCFSGRLPGVERDFGAVDPTRWSAIAARCCPEAIISVRDAVPPKFAFTILMESAIYTSKLDRGTIETA